METEAAVDDPEPETPPRRRRLWLRLVVLGLAVLVVLVGIAGAWSVLSAQPEITYEGPDGVVSPGAEVTIRDPEGECGPLVVSLHRKGRVGLWSQTHSGNVVSGFHPDARSWRSLTGGSYFTPVPCAPGGDISFTLPADLAPGTIAACDVDRRCAEIRVG